MGIVSSMKLELPETSPCLYPAILESMSRFLQWHKNIKIYSLYFNNLKNTETRKFIKEAASLIFIMRPKASLTGCYARS